MTNAQGRPQQPLPCFVVSIEDRNTNGKLAFDVWDVFRELGRSVSSCRWIVRDLECVGQNTEQLCQSVEEAARHGPGLILSAADLEHSLRRIRQTIDGTFVACPQDSSPKDMAEAGTLGNFPQSKAVVAICMIDSTVCDVLTKNQKHVESLRRRFRAVTDRSSADYF